MEEQRSSEPISYDSDSRLDSTADKLGSYELAKIRLDATEDGDQLEKMSPHLRKTRRYARRGGRPYPEKSGRDVAREIANKDAEENPDTRTPEEKQAVAKRGAEACRAALRDMRENE